MPLSSAKGEERFPQAFIKKKTLVTTLKNMEILSLEF